MLKFLYNYQVVMSFSPEVSTHALMLRCQPAVNAMQHIDEEHLVMPPSFRMNRGIDAYGNRIISGSTMLPHSSLAYVSCGIVSQGEYVIPDGSPKPYYRMPSRLTVPSAEMEELEIEELADTSLPIYDKALLISRKVNGMISYSPGSTSLMTTAAEAFALGKGVCQDYAHIMIALCRLHGITARYANGFIIGEGVTHAWVEVHDGYAWRAIDPTHDTFIYSGYIKLAHGRDALDCTVDRGTFTGLTAQHTDISVTVAAL